MTNQLTRIFISYRRTVSEYTARAIESQLPKDKYDVFYDIDSINSGQFRSTILEEIATRTYFILIIDKGTLDKCSQEDDVLRQEIEYALELNKIIIPILVNNLSFNDIEQNLINELKRIKEWQAIPLINFYFPYFMSMLRVRFLKEDSLQIAPISAAIEEIEYVKRAEEEAKRNATKAQFEAAQAELEDLSRLQTDLMSELASLTVTNRALKSEMVEVKRQIVVLGQISAPTCPTCGQVLDETQRHKMMESATHIGSARGNAWKLNKDRIDSIEHELSQIRILSGQLRELISTLR